MDRLELANRPRCRGVRGAYEVWYVTVNQPAEGRGFWVRYTTFTPGPAAAAAPHAALWAFSFHRGAPGRNAALKVTFPLDAVSYAEPFEVSIADAAIGLRGCHGSLEAPGGSARWDLAWTSHAEPFFFLEPRWQKLASAANVGAQPALEVSGEIEIGGETFRLDRAPGGQQHTWGRRHALEWNWGFASGLGGRRGDFVDGASTRLRGPAGTALRGTAAGVLLDGRRVAANTLPATLRAATRISAEAWTATVQDGDLEAEVAITPRVEDLIGVTYDDPAGGIRVCYHTELADLDLRLTEAGREVARERREAAAAFEYASEAARPELPAPRL